MHKWVGILLFIASALNAAPRQNPWGARASEQDRLRHEVENHEAEIRMFEERLSTQEVIVDALRQQVLDANHENRELVKQSAVVLENNVALLEASVKAVVDDLHGLQTHGNSMSKVLNQHKQTIEEIERKMDRLQESLQLVLSALEVSVEGQIYEVVSRDTLEKIARKHETTIKKIMDLNKLTSDRIYPGQKLKIP